MRAGVRDSIVGRRLLDESRGFVSAAWGVGCCMLLLNTTVRYRLDTDRLSHCKAFGLLRWMREGAWGFCDLCGSVFRRPLMDSAFNSQPEDFVATSCPNCTGPYIVPDWKAVPGPLLHLSSAEASMLRPFVIHLGDSAQGHPRGYMRHRQCLRLSAML